MMTRDLWSRIRTLSTRVWAQCFVKWSVWAALTSAGISLALPNYYKSEAILLPSDSSASVLGSFAGAAAALGVGLPGGQGGQDQSFEAIIRSRWMGEALLTHSFSYSESNFLFGPKRKYQNTLLQELDAKNLDRGMVALDQTISLDRDLKTNVLTIGVETRSPELSQQVVKLVVRLLNDFITNHNKTTNGEKAKFIAERMAEAEANSKASEKLLRAFLMKNRNFAQSSDPDIQLDGSRLQSDLQMRKQIQLTLALNFEQTLSDAKNNTPVVNFVDEGSLPVEKSHPSRALIVLVAAVVTGILVFAIEHRDRIRAYMANSEEQR